MAAEREAKEETGCELQDLKYLCSQNSANGMSDAIVHVFAAKVSAESKIIDTEEVSSKRWFKEDEYFELLRTNGTKDGVSILAILYALQFYAQRFKMHIRNAPFNACEFQVKGDLVMDLHEALRTVWEGFDAPATCCRK